VTDGAATPADGGLREYVRVLRRHKLLVLQAVVLVPLIAFGLSRLQDARYEASADVLVSHQNLANSLNGIEDPVAAEEADRLLVTQALLAGTDAVASRTVRAAGVPDLTVAEFLDSSSVMPRRDSDVLRFRVEAAGPEVARVLAAEYARQFTRYRLQLDTQSLTRARLQVAARIRRLRAAGPRASNPLYQTLVEREQQLHTMEALQTSNATPLGLTRTVEQVQPRTVRNVLLGLVLGAVLGIALAFLRNALDTRIRSLDEIEDHLRVPLLGRVPRPSTSLGPNRIVMLEDPATADAEGYWMLRATLEFAAGERAAKSILIASALEGEGKSTTASNLALALARVGRRVALVDLDLRGPTLHRFFGLSTRPGVTDVALGRVPVEEALIDIPVTGRGDPDLGGRALSVLPAGSREHNPGELVGSGRALDVIASLQDRFDFVIVDSPPFLRISDPMSLARDLDGLVLIVRLDRTSRPVLREVERVLAASRVEPLGYVLTGGEPETAYGYGYGTEEEEHEATDLAAVR